MGIYLELVDHDELYQRSRYQENVINDFDLNNKEEVRRFDNLITTYYTGKESLELIPACDCEKLRGGEYTDMICDICNTRCLPITERPLESTLWIRVPEGVNYFMNPIAWLMLCKMFDNTSAVMERTLRWLMDPLAKVDESKIISYLKARNVKRGINYFQENFDDIFDLIIESKNYRKGCKTYARMLENREFVENNKKHFFSKYLPVPSKMLFVLEKPSTQVYYDRAFPLAKEALLTISHLSHPTVPISQTSIISKTVKANISLAYYYDEFFSESLAKDVGLFRQHIYGGRNHFTFRAVVSSLHEPHFYDEIHLPWSIAVMVLKIHLISLMKKMGWSPNQSIEYIHRHFLVYDPHIIAPLFEQLINGSPTKGINILLQRNPTLTRGSCQKLRVTKVKEDPHDLAIAISVLLLKAPNADFDGDALNGVLITDNKLLEKANHLHPRYYALDLNEPRKVSRFVWIPDPVVSTLSNFVDYGREVENNG